MFGGTCLQSRGLGRLKGQDYRFKATLGKVSSTGGSEMEKGTQKKGHSGQDLGEPALEQAWSTRGILETVSTVRSRAREAGEDQRAEDQRVGGLCSKDVDAVCLEQSS